MLKSDSSAIADASVLFLCNSLRAWRVMLAALQEHVCGSHAGVVKQCERNTGQGLASDMLTLGVMYSRAAVSVQPVCASVRHQAACCGKSIWTAAKRMHLPQGPTHPAALRGQAHSASSLTSLSKQGFGNRNHNAGSALAQHETRGNNDHEAAVTLGSPPQPGLLHDGPNDARDGEAGANIHALHTEQSISDGGWAAWRQACCCCCCCCCLSIAAGTLW